MSNILELKNISKYFQFDELKTMALSDISFSVKGGEYVSINGPSGCGKSTLLSILGMLDTPSGGQYFLSGNDVSNLSRDQRATVRCNHIGFVFQSFNLISDLTIEENVILPLTYQDKYNAKEAKEKALSVLEQVDMLHRVKHFPSALSGGQQQRIAIARALVNDPKLILADEPTGNLDSKNADIVLQLFDDLHQQGRTICMVTHDPRSSACASRRIDIFDGQLVSDKPLPELAKSA
ncbi:ABC transporter ATP-binding protein [Pseudoalteromonas sp. OOF1S-7]|uniref:ABC transporter ATP-binding protein n=1 Tax=Pseudoalteromonas sp. OOF1S-7 TaxID=2917757 RepID=UPI001EF56765|nr:ABC transporter ATP-binding protein [Pseudoalteromonas sp. OOF1S-7]MCG7537798.1 ABC transporter ATP-binding protein [Pseudoalteromonas sp. OOF1S-7]